MNRSIALCLICYRLPNHLVYIKGCDRMAILHNGWKSLKISFSREKLVNSKSWIFPRQTTIFARNLPNCKMWHFRANFKHCEEIHCISHLVNGLLISALIENGPRSRAKGLLATKTRIETATNLNLLDFYSILFFQQVLQPYFIGLLLLKAAKKSGNSF